MKTMMRYGLLLALAAGTAQRAMAQAEQPPVDPQTAEAPAARGVRPLFAGAQAPEEATLLPQAVSGYAVMPDIALMGETVVGDRIELEISEGQKLVMIVTRVERHGPSSVSVRGRLEGFDGSSVLFATQDDALAGDISAPPVNLHYKMKYAANGVHFVCRMNDDLYAPCKGTPPDTISPPEDFAPEAGEMEGISPDDGAGNPATGTCSAVEVVFDAMIVYTDVARAAAGGTSAIQAECQLAVDRANESYDNSPISARMRLVRRYEITYNESGTFDDHLDRLTGTNGMGGSAPWTSVRSDRDTYNADFCSLFVNDGDYCGLGWCTAAANRAYTIVNWGCAAGSLSFPHEVGHNQGCAHDHDNDSSGTCGAYSYSYGHRFFGTNGTQYRTVMAYAPGTRIPYFSNPDRTYQGTATGVAGTGPTAARNEDTIENRKATCEGFELTRWDIWVDFAYSGLEIGTFALPYNSMTEGVANIDDYVSGASEYPNLYVKPGTTTYTGTISKPMTIIACGGPVQIGS